MSGDGYIQVWYFLDKNAASIKVKDSVVHWVSDSYAMWLLNEKNKYFGFLWNMIGPEKFAFRLAF